MKKEMYFQRVNAFPLGEVKMWNEGVEKLPMSIGKYFRGKKLEWSSL
jgi:hypothetical protein